MRRSRRWRISPTAAPGPAHGPPSEQGGRQGRALYRGLHSIGFAACAGSLDRRPRPRSPGQFVLAQTKNNFDPPGRQPGLSHRHGGSTAPPHRMARREPWADDDLVSLPPRYRRRLRAEQFLAQVLKDGPRLTRDLWPQARELGLSERTLRRARQDLNVRTARAGVFGPNQPVYWLLPEQDLPADVGPAAPTWTPSSRNSSNNSREAPLDEM